MMDDDVFTDSGPQIVDFDLLEASKENVQPLASGRRVTALSALLATPHGQREAKLNATRNRLRVNIELALEDEDEDSDPLEAYSQLVHWTMENYPQGNSSESGLVELIEEATRVLKDHNGGIWKREMRYLKLWLLYTGHVDRPTIIYQFLLANEIGTGHALLYEEYAAVLEKDGRRKDADDIYMLGIHRKAQPLDHLKRRHEEFQKRMMLLPAVESSGTEESTQPDPAAAPKPKRAILGDSKVHKITAASSTTPQPRSAPSRNFPNGRIQPFVDTSEQDTPVEPTEYPDMGTRQSRNAQNRSEKKPMAGAKIKEKGKTKRAAMRNAGSRIDVFVDPEGDEEMLPPPRNASPVAATGGSAVPPSTPKFMPFRDHLEDDEDVRTSPVPGSALKVRDTSEAEALRKDPLKNY